MKQKKIVVINDLLPTEQPGAASIAYRLFNEFKAESSARYWTTSVQPKSLIHENPDISLFGISEDAARQSSRGLKHKLKREYLSLAPLIWLYKQVRAERPSVVLVQQIGNRFPRTLIPLMNFMGVHVICTLHDFSWLVPRKLFPRDLKISSSEFLEKGKLEGSRQADNSIKREGSLLRHTVFRVRLFINRQILNHCASVIAISQLQAEIYKSFGFKISTVIPNSVEKCSCKLPLETRRGNTILLFAGRSYAKGLEDVFEITQENPSTVLYLAGPADLLERAKSELNPDQFHYFGNLEPGDLYKLLHKIGFVVVLSECFDVYPTITLEALSHGALVLTNRNTGNSELVASINPDMVIDDVATLDFDALALMSTEIRDSKKFKEVQNRVSGDEMFLEYSRYVNRILTL